MRLTTVVAVLVCAITAAFQLDAQSGAPDKPPNTFDAAIDRHANRMLEEGRQIFRFDTFGDEAFWGDTLKLHQAIEGFPSQPPHDERLQAFVIAYWSGGNEVFG